MKMVHFHVQHIIGFLSIFTIFLSGAVAVFRKTQCEVDENYKICYIEQEEFCHPFSKAEGLKISNMEKSAVILKSFIPIHHGNELKIDKKCTFTIKTKNKEEGLFAVIQNINFRRNADGCVDYVQFKRDDSDFWSEKWCGEINRKNNESRVPHNSFSEYDPRGKLETLIFISKESMNQQEFLDISIVYTPSIRCDKVDRRNYRKVTDSICIWKDYICDNYQNCAISDCDDERQCIRNLENDGTGTKVTVGAVTTIFLCFILFVTCLWICKKQKKLCWSTDCAGPVISRQQSDTDLNRVRTSTSAPTAPMLEISVPSTMQDKDLPPSYDSLFPERSNTTST